MLNGIEEIKIDPFFTIGMPPVMDVMPALILSFCIGLGITFLKGDALQKAFLEFREIITMIIKNIIIPFLPLYIFGMFLSMSVSGQVYSVIVLFMKVILVIFILLRIAADNTVPGCRSDIGKEPLKALKGMLPAYATALGTSSSAATIPVTLQCAINNKVNPAIASFTIPLCATIHLAGSTMKITGFALAIQYFFGIPIDLPVFIGFIFMLGIIMIAAPVCPGAPSWRR
ncbi:MAG: dicarboxylate/amino acid:cation symporter [Marinilabiliales bacterium]|nr:dicarboxylate/amino acid:cation symporter [Marinilabiliales bacterium]